MSVHIGRLQKIGFGKESTAGAPVVATDWLPKREGGMAPEIETVENDAAYGNITRLRDAQAVKEVSIVDIGGTIDDTIMGHILLSCLGQTYMTEKHEVTSISGVFVDGETITGGTSGATGILRRNDVSGSTGDLYVEVSSGTFAAAETLTGGTSSATATLGTIRIAAASGSSHLFRLLNSNNHPSFTFYVTDSVGTFRAPYCMLDELSIDIVVGEYAKFTAKYMGKTMVSTSATPSYATENPFLAKFATFKTASAFSGLSGASAISVERLKIDFKKNLEAVQALGSIDVNSIHNKAFEVSGDFTLKYENTDMLGYVQGSDNRAVRLTLANSDVTLDNSNPTLQIDIPQAGMVSWNRDNQNDNIVRETIGFVAEYNIDRGFPVEVLLQNSRLTAY